MPELQMTDYRLVSQTDVLVAQAALTEGFTATEPGRMVITAGYRGCRIVPVGATATGATGGTLVSAQVYIVDRVEGEHAPGAPDQGWFITLIGALAGGTITFSGAVATGGRSPNLRLISTNTSVYTEDASFTPRRIYATTTAGFGLPDEGVAPNFEILIPELSNAYAVIVQFEGTFGGSLGNVNAYIALDV